MDNAIPVAVINWVIGVMVSALIALGILVALVLIWEKKPPDKAEEP